MKDPLRRSTLFFAACLAGLFASGCHHPGEARASDESAAYIDYVRPVMLDEESFRHVAEYFGGTERTAGRAIVRSIPEERSGNYFIVELKRDLRELPAGTRVRLETIVAGQPEPALLELPVPGEPAGTRELFVGLTGEDALTEETSLLAWRLSLVGGEGEILDRFESFLWSHPGRG